MNPTPTKYGLALAMRDAALGWRNELDKFADYHALPRWKQLEKYDQATRKAQVECRKVNRLALKTFHVSRYGGNFRGATLQLFC